MKRCIVEMNRLKKNVDEHAWDGLSDLGHPEQVKIAMDEVYQRLVDRNHALVRLFDPPFEKSALNPGYIQGSVPGARENGGQYTHAAIWAASQLVDSHQKELVEK